MTATMTAQEAAARIREALEMLAQRIERAAGHRTLAISAEAADAIRALLAERDEMAKDAARLQARLDALDNLPAEDFIRKVARQMGCKPAPGAGEPLAADMVLVPREPTSEMLHRAMKDCGGIGGGSNPASELGVNDPLMPQAVALVAEHRRASISLVQRYLRIGYNRAAYMLEAMEKQGIVRVNPTPGGSQYLIVKDTPQ